MAFGDITTGPENDLEHATALARQMVCVYGMSKVIGVAHLVAPQAIFFPTSPDGFTRRDCSEATACEVDEEVKRILGGAYEQAKRILTAHRNQLDRVAGELVKSETMDAATVRRLIGQPEPAGGDPGNNPEH
ncbi:MAG TPA: hypothetical protein VLV45_10960 [Gemmatimonadales bacterium]|nr:hypothetical protein [Gemmatimonadales bacterium]